ncbi:MAG: cobyrinate a,c-diamide synthase [Thiolinea sp.]
MVSVLISAAHKSSGKTTLSIGLCAAMHARNLRVQAFKKGPDYIDPLWLSAASDNPCHNLDFNTMTHSEILQTLQYYGANADFRLIEANKGLYDGIALDGSDSNAALAKLTDSAVILVLDTRGMTRGIAPLLMGYQAFDHDVNIAGVILNRTGGDRHVGKLQRAVEEYTDVTVLGAVRNDPEMVIEERHLGLMPSNESDEAERRIVQIRNLVADQVDLDKVFELGVDRERTDVPKAPLALNHPVEAPVNSSKNQSLPKAFPVRVAVCQDPAFAFYYPGDLDALQQAGAEIVPVNTLTDKSLPEVDGLFIGGGFPETQMHRLAANESLRADIYQAIEDGLPVYAECGGLMYLSRSIHWRGEQAEMVGIIPGDAVMHEKPQGRGYVKLQETADMIWPGGDTAQTINAHEFHYSALENLAQTGRFAFRMLRGQGIDGQHDGWIYKNLLASYTHMRHTAQFPWAQRFIEFIRLQKTSVLQQQRIA